MQRFPLPVALALLLASSGIAIARPVHKQALADYYGPFLARSLNDCRTCHVAEPPGADPSEPRPHNAFGARLKAVRDELRKAGRKTSLVDRLEAVAQEDSDGDGVSNLVELLTGHNPGDPADKPTAAELSAASERIAAFRRSQSDYPWRPFETVRRPPVPSVHRTQWARNPIDAFIAAEHEAHGLTPRPEADRPVLLRRVHLDLIGLPPTPEELHTFLDDSSPDAFEKVVDRLLDRPQYGERWGRHWMDVWRYSDWAGYKEQIRDSQPHIWRWRDWIVQSLNRDKGYDRMILEMLAGDELAPDDPDTLRATGYLVRNYKLLSREKWMQDVVDYTAESFLGVTLGCARCHDHMYDPIMQKEYYQVRAIFEPHRVRIDPVPGEFNRKKNGLARAYDEDLEVQTFLFVRGDERTPDKTPLSPGIPEVLGGHFPAIVPLDSSIPVEAAALRSLSMNLPTNYPEPSTGRRLAFARWIADRANPLTARVAMNHIWLRHFGQALVPSVFDFGRNGRPPSHPALLDWLAAEFMDCGWSMKAMHRLIVTSNTYRLASTPDSADIALDSDNKYLWRMPSRRVEAEVVRDCVFQVAGRLDVTMGGPDIPHEQGLKNPRRSLYFRHASEKQMEFLKIFDCAAVTECYQRKESIVPQQALALANSELGWSMAQRLARDLSERCSDDAAFAVAAFERVLSRPPTSAERAECSTFLAHQPRASLVHVLLNHHEFVTIR